MGYVLYEMRRRALDSSEGMTVKKAEVLGARDSNTDFEQQQGHADADHRNANLLQKTSQESLVARKGEQKYVRSVNVSSAEQGHVVRT